MTSGCGCGCGTPSRKQLLPDLTVPGARATPAPGAGRHPIEQITLPAGTFTMGDSSGDKNRADGETPRHEVALSAFDIDATTVTNDASPASSRRPATSPRPSASGSPPSSISRSPRPRRT